MTVKHDCDNYEALIGYLYEESDAAERTAVAAHLAGCTRCATELASLRATRVDLAAWTPPETHLGFRIVADAAPAFTPKVLRPARWWNQPMPAWAQAAAAVLIFAVGAGLGALNGGTGGTGAPASASTAVAGAPAVPADPGNGAAANPGHALPSRDGVSADQLAQLEQRLRSEMAAGARPGVTPVAGAAGAPTLEQVRALIQESEQRQQRELAFRTAEVIRDFDTQRRGDLARIEQTFGQMEGNTGVQVEQQRQMLNYLMRVSQRPQ